MNQARILTTTTERNPSKRSVVRPGRQQKREAISENVAAQSGITRREVLGSFGGGAVGASLGNMGGTARGPFPGRSASAGNPHAA